MSTLPWKIRIAVLWAIGPILESFNTMLYVHIDEKSLTRLGTLAIHATAFFVAPLLMSLLSLTLKDKINRWANIVIGLIFAFVLAPIWFLEGGIGVIAYEGPTLGVEHALLAGLKIVVALFIPWFAWKWPKQEA